jgi:small subunit ribosomal protein S3Ae
LSYRKFKFKCIDYSNGNCFTGFNGLDLTRDKFSSLIKKWHTIVESCLDLKTKDGFYLRIFIVAFSKKLKNQIKKFAYLQSSQIRSVRRKIEQIVTREGLLSSMKDLIGKINSEKINEEIKKVCSRIFPLQNIFIKKVKVIQRPVDSKD